jgi:hypothetical protein
VGSVEYDGTDADEDVVFEGAAVDGGVVADGAAVSDDDGVEVALAVDYGAVLDVGAGADADAVDVAAENGVHPDGGLRAELDVADDLGGGVDVAAGGDGGGDTAEGAKHGYSVGSCADGETRSGCWKWRGWRWGGFGSSDREESLKMWANGEVGRAKDELDEYFGGFVLFRVY